MNRRIRIAVSVALLGASSATFATNGYWSLGYGPKSKSIAGACVAMAFGGMCAASNPGSLAVVGSRIEVGAGIFAPRRGFTANDDASPTMPPASIPPGTYDSGNDWFLIPHLAYNKMLDDNSSLGISIGANGGMNTEYDSAVFQNFANPGDPRTIPTNTTGIDMMQMFMGVTYSRRLNSQHSVGITPILAIQSLEAKGLQPFIPFSLHPSEVTNKGHDISYGGGVRLGWLWQVNDRFNFGASYQTKMWMSKFDRYRGLLAEEGSFDIPANYDIGFSYRVTPKVTFAFDYQRIDYGGVRAVSNASNLVFMPGETLLGTDDGLGFGWNDLDIYKMGVEWAYRPDLTLRAGFAIAGESFPNSQALFNTLAPAVVTKHFAFGFGKKLNEHEEINFALNYAPNEKVHGTNPNTGPQTGYLEMDQVEVELGWVKRF